MKKFIYSIFLILTVLIASNAVHAASTDYDGKWNGLISCTAYSGNATLGAFTRNNVYAIENGKVTSKYTTAGGKNVLTTTGVISGVNTNLTISGTSETAQWFFNFKGKPSSAENISYIGEMVEQGVKKRDCTMEFSALDPAIGSLAFKKINSNQIASSSQPIKTPTSEAAKSPVTPTVPPVTKNAAPVQPVQPAISPAPKVAEKATSPQPASIGTASFDCNKATSVQEKLICTTPALSALDLKLAEVYKSAQAVSPDVGKLKSEQIAWIKETRACGGDVTCSERLYSTRIDELNLLLPKHTPEPVSITPPTSASSVGQATNMPQPSPGSSEAPPAENVTTATPPAIASVAVDTQIESSESKQNILFGTDFQRYAFIALGGIFTLIAAYFLFKYLISLAKRTASKASSAARAGVSKLSEEADSLKEGLSNRAQDISAQAKARASNLATDFNKEGGFKDKIKSISQKSFDRVSKAGSDLQQEAEKINNIRMKFEKVNDTTVKTLESVEAINPEIRKVIESLGGKVKSVTSSEIEASFRYGINLYGIIISAKIHRDNSETFIEIKGFFKDSIDNGAAASKATEILNSLTGNIEQKKDIDFSKGILENLTSKIKTAFESYIILFKHSPWIVGSITLILIGLLFGDGKSVSNEYKQETDYVYYSDGSCKNHKGIVCIDIKQAQYLCEKSTGVTNYLYDNLKYGNIGDKAKTLFTDGSVGAFNYSWNGRQCGANISAEGFYNGNSAKARLSGYVHTFVINKDQKALIHGAFMDLN